MECPSCGSEIKALQVFGSIPAVGTYDGEFQYSNDSAGDLEWDDTDFQCPECGDTLAQSEEEAKALLKEAEEQAAQQRQEDEGDDAW